MKRLISGFSLWTTVLVVAFGLAQCASAGPYMIVPLGTLGGDGPWVEGLNDSGQVVGYDYISTSGNHPFLYSNGTLTDLGFSGIAWGINNSGQIVGSSNNTAFLYSNGTMTNLGSFGGSFGSIAYSINNSGQIAGVSWTSGNASLDAFLYSKGTMTDLGSLGSGTVPYPLSINNSGQVVGTQNGQAFLYATQTNLGSLGGFYSSSATGINNSGQVVGFSATNPNTNVNNYPQGFLYSNGTFTDLNTVGGFYSSLPTGINNSGQVVGGTYDPNSGSGSFLYSNGKVVDLNSLLPQGSGWTIYHPAAINDNGQIAGNGIFNGVAEAFLMTPGGNGSSGGGPIATPEPSTFVMVGIILAAMAVYEWRRRKRTLN
jgi:probable HAF family extracellular repeat protein